MQYVLKRAVAISCAGLAALLLGLGSAGWSSPEEITGTVSEVGADYLVVDDMRFSVNGATTFEEGYDALSDVQVGDEVEIEYKKNGDEMIAREVEAADDDEEKGEQETSGTVQEIGTDFLIIDGTRYVLTADTEFDEGYMELADVEPGDDVENEYEARSDGVRVALEVEGGGDDEGDGQ